MVLNFERIGEVTPESSLAGGIVLLWVGRGTKASDKTWRAYVETCFLDSRISIEAKERVWSVSER